MTRAGPRANAPSAAAWLVALLSAVLPWAGAALIALGVWRMATLGPTHVWLAAIGILLIAVDFVIDVVWAHPSLTPSDEPCLNKRGEQLLGRVFVLTTAIEGGRGAIVCGDTVWQVEGPELAVGQRVRIVAANGMLLCVDPVLSPRKR